MLKVEGKPYNLRYTLNAIDAIETTLGGKSILEYIGRESLPALSVLRSWFVFALTDADGASVPIEKGVDIFNKALEELGYKAVYELCATIFQKDCGFFFLPGIGDSAT